MEKIERTPTIYEALFALKQRLENFVTSETDFYQLVENVIVGETDRDLTDPVVLAHTKSIYAELFELVERDEDSEVVGVVDRLDVFRNHLAQLRAHIDEALAERASEALLTFVSNEPALLRRELLGDSTGDDTAVDDLALLIRWYKEQLNEAQVLAEKMIHEPEFSWE